MRLSFSIVMDLATFYHDQLFIDCLPFWFPRAVDETHGGFLHCFDRDCALVDSDKSVWALCFQRKLRRHRVCGSCGGD